MEQLATNHNLVASALNLFANLDGNAWYRGHRPTHHQDDCRRASKHTPTHVHTFCLLDLADLTDWSDLSCQTLFRVYQTQGQKKRAVERSRVSLFRSRLAVRGSHKALCASLPTPHFTQPRVS